MSVVEVDFGAILALAAPGGIVNDDMRRRGFAIHAAAVPNAPVDTGRLRASGEVVEVTDVPGAYDVIFTVDYAVWVHDGTRYMAARPWLRDAMPAGLT